MKKACISLMVLSLIMSVFAMPVLAQTTTYLLSEADMIQPRFTYISSTSTSVAIDGGEVSVSGSMNCYSNATSCKAVVYLQRREIGTTTWYNKAIFTGYGVRYCVASGTRTANVGYEYRAMAVYTVNDGAEKTTSYSRIAQYTSSTP